MLPRNYLGAAAILMLLVNPEGAAADIAKFSPVGILVKETIGVRRTSYPASAQIQISRELLKEPLRLRLRLDDADVPIQTWVESRWPDESIRTLRVYFNVSIGPLSQQHYQLQIDNRAGAPTEIKNGLTVREVEHGLQAGAVRFGQGPTRLLRSVNYNGELIGAGVNSFTVTDVNGVTHVLAGMESTRAEVVRSGPLNVLIRYVSSQKLDADYAVPFEITLEAPNSKSWIKFNADIQDPKRRIRSIGLSTPLALDKHPWTWDVGVGSWTYGVLRDARDSVVLIQTVPVTGTADWQIVTGVKGSEQPYERASPYRSRRAEGWGHIQDQHQVVAFAFDGFGSTPGTYSIALDGTGQLTFQFSAAQAAIRHQLCIYQHYVLSPTPIGAATHPVSMSNPLVVEIDSAANW